MPRTRHSSRATLPCRTCLPYQLSQSSYAPFSNPFCCRNHHHCMVNYPHDARNGSRCAPPSSDTSPIHAFHASILHARTKCNPQSSCNDLEREALKKTGNIQQPKRPARRMNYLHQTVCHPSRRSSMKRRHSCKIQRNRHATPSSAAEP